MSTSVLSAHSSVSGSPAVIRSASIRARENFTALFQMLRHFSLSCSAPLHAADSHSECALRLCPSSSSTLSSVNSAEEKSYEKLPPLDESVAVHLYPPMAIEWKTKAAHPSEPCRKRSVLPDMLFPQLDRRPWHYIPLTRFSHPPSSLFGPAVDLPAQAFKLVICPGSP
ncbi:hypothetical protein Q8A67_012493 [Cirrhinus molitorella]|uniref:Uncharacterized protein n=1 Tax=Cirrhinus molitorella TaxID=172907 RepID=A0AA88PK27_9TELE|nr:hypothetical protein Q8A67_012493 [Cirrhinus molitorella]